MKRVVTRINGSTRYDTSALIAGALGNFTKIAVVTGSNFPDALAGSVLADATTLGTYPFTIYASVNGQDITIVYNLIVSNDENLFYRLVGSKVTGILKGIYSILKPDEPSGYVYHNRYNSSWVSAAISKAFTNTNNYKNNNLKEIEDLITQRTDKELYENSISGTNFTIDYDVSVYFSRLYQIIADSNFIMGNWINRIKLEIIAVYSPKTEIYATI